MDVEPQQSRFSLARLPKEVLAQLLTSTNSFLVINLYLCGDKRLNYKLEHGGCVEVNLLDRKMDSKSRFPSLLKSLLQLRRLKIIRYGYLLHPHGYLSLALQELSPELRKLEIQSFGCYEAFLRFPDPNLESYPEGIFYDYNKGRSRLWNIGATFPKLQELKIGRNVKGVFSRAKAPIEMQDLVVLPDSLTHLSMNLAFVGEFEDLAAILPRNLQVFESFKLDTTSVKIWPPNLTYLSHMDSPGSTHHPSAEYYHRLGNTPRSMAEIRFFSQQTFNPDFAASMPPNLNFLCFNAIADTEFTRLGIVPWMKALPIRLKSLDIWTPLSFELLASLPRTLTFLSAPLDFLDLADHFFQPDLYREMRRRRKRNETKLEREIRENPIATIPLPPIDLSFWPPDLQTLDMMFEDEYEVSTEAQIMILPKTLTKLRLKLGDNSYMKQDKRKLQMEYFWLHNLHIVCPKLRNLALHSTLDRPIYFRWPIEDTSLRKLLLDGNFTGCMYNLSQSKFQLPIPQPPRIDLSTGSLDYSDFDEFSDFRVPETVIELKLDIWRIRDALRIAVSGLPSKLRHFAVTAENAMTHSMYWTEHLVLRPSFFDTLPKTLLVLVFEDLPALPNALTHLPPSLTHLQLEICTEVTEVYEENSANHNPRNTFRSSDNQDGFCDFELAEHDYFDRYMIEGEHQGSKRNPAFYPAYTFSEAELKAFDAHCPHLSHFWPELEDVPVENLETIEKFWPLRTLSEAAFFGDLRDYPKQLYKTSLRLIEKSKMLADVRRKQ